VRIKLQLGTGLDVKDVQFDGEKRELSAELIFYGAGREAAAGNVEVVAYDGTRLFCGVLTVSGLTAKPAFEARTEPVMALAERRLSEAPPGGRGGRKAKGGTKIVDSGDSGLDDLK
jgi:hypothetical protein